MAILNHHKTLLFLILLTLVSPHVFGKTLDPNPLPVQWFRPEFSKKWDSGLRVLIQGQTNIENRISVDGENFLYKTKGETTPVQVNGIKKQVFEKKDREANGFFQLHFDLEYGTWHIPITISNDRHSTLYVLVVDVKEGQVKIVGEGRLDSSPFFKKQFGVWFGAGYNYLLYKQGSLSFASFAAPSLYFKLWYELIPYFDINLTVKSSPGETSSNPSVQISEGNYSWTTFGLEFAYAPEFMETHFWGMDALFGFMVGAQLHKIPYILQVSSSQASISTNDVLMGSIGGRLLLVQSRTWEYEIFLRYQPILDDGDLFDIQSSSTADGSLGVIYRFPDRSWRLGAFFYGQNFSYQSSRFNSVTSLDDELDQTLFFSNLELRLGYEF